MKSWLEKAVFYEIYPQSFLDTNNDGIGDLKGIINKLEYVKQLGCNAIWLNPIYPSMFEDAGYDIIDYYGIAERYGSMNDFKELVEKAHQLEIKIVMDLVIGHTSIHHPWFKESSKNERNENSDFYIWTNSYNDNCSGYWGSKLVKYNGERKAQYMCNYYEIQPAINYGFYTVEEDWQVSYKSEIVENNVNRIIDVVLYWLKLGVDGFRCDMADSLVKNDSENIGTCYIWSKIKQAMLEYNPESVLISEWSNPSKASKAGFDVDFYLDHHHNGYNYLLRDNETEGENHSYFKSEADSDIDLFLTDFLNRYESIKEQGRIGWLTCNHDTPRAKRTLNDEELKIAYATLLTLPGVPFIYYGDEIGMNYLDLPSIEGGLERTGSRSPMQWNHNKNYGFSNNDYTYTPVDNSENAPTVEDNLKDDNSLLNVLKKIIKVKQNYSFLDSDASFELISKVPFVFKREEYFIIVNPKITSYKLDMAFNEVIFSIGDIDFDGVVNIGPQSLAIIR